MQIDATATVISENDVVSPISGQKAAFVRLEVLVGVRSLGTIIFGDVLRLQMERTTLTLVARRAQYQTVRDVPATPLTQPPPELVPFLRRGCGPFSVREHLVVKGQRLRVRATVEGHPTRLFARDDLGPVVLDELLF